jgi:uncharacterized membrane protein
VAQDRVDAVINWLIGIVIVAVVCAFLYGLAVFINSVSQKLIDDRCSNIAWRAAKSAGTEAGRVAEVACRLEAGQDK